MDEADARIGLTTVAKGVGYDHLQEAAKAGATTSHHQMTTLRLRARVIRNIKGLGLCPGARNCPPGLRSPRPR